MKNMKDCFKQSCFHLSDGVWFTKLQKRQVMWIPMKKQGKGKAVPVHTMTA
jgi:hypothetical protein